MTRALFHPRSTPRPNRSGAFEAAIQPGHGAFAQEWLWTLRQDGTPIGRGHAATRQAALAVAEATARALELVRIVAA